jgi:hypothetical protein
MKFVLALFALASATSASSTQPWQITNVVDSDSSDSQGVSEVSFDFSNPETGVKTTCSYKNAVGSGRPATVLTYANCENPNVRFTYEETSSKTANIAVEYFFMNEAYAISPLDF